jgi:hypothetical protein
LRVDVPMSYPASPHAVVAMLVDRAYQERKCAALDARHVRIAIHPDTATYPDTATPTVVADRVMPPYGAPDVIRAMVPSGIRVVETVSWAPAARDGSRAAAIRLDFPHHPLMLRGTLSLVRADGGTRATVAGQLRAAVPFMAGRVERMAAKLIVRAITIEHGVGRDWLAGNDRQR